MVNAQPQGQTPLHDDLVRMLTATRAAELDLFGMLPSDQRDGARQIGEWSAKDVQAHLAAWRSTEAHRLESGVYDRPADSAPEGLPAPQSEDVTNARIQAERAGWTWEQVTNEAQASIDSLVAAIRATSAVALRTSERLVAGIGSNGANHAIGHLSDVARLVGPVGDERFRAFAGEIEAILMDGRLPDRDSGVMLYNIACHSALSGELADARRQLSDALQRRPDLIEFAPTDPDLAALHGELDQLASPPAPG
jgi:hypothetical protein